MNTERPAGAARRPRVPYTGTGRHFHLSAKDFTLGKELLTDFLFNDLFTHVLGSELMKTLVVLAVWDSYSLCY